MSRKQAFGLWVWRNLQEKGHAAKSCPMGFDRVTLSPLPVRDAGQDRELAVMRKLPVTGFHKVNVPAAVTKTRGTQMGTARLS